MKKGDLVRYRPLVFQETQPKWEIGLLVEYHTWEKLATVMKDGKFFENVGVPRNPILASIAGVGLLETDEEYGGEL